MVSLQTKGAQSLFWSENWISCLLQWAGNLNFCSGMIWHLLLVMRPKSKYVPSEIKPPLSFNKGIQGIYKQSTVHSVLRKVCLGTEPYSFVYICQSVHFATLFFLPGVLSLTSVHIHNGPKLFFPTFFHFFQDKRNIAFQSTSFQKVSFIKEFEQKFYRE